MRARIAVTVAAAGLLLAACGGDDNKRSTTTQPEALPTTTGTTPSSTQSAPATAPTETQPTPTSTSPEKQPGGAGDEEPARSLALFTGRNGRITPLVVRVPPFISIRVELRSSDGRNYRLAFGRKAIQVGGGLSSASTTFDGLRPGAALVGTPTGAASEVRIEASAEPGP